MSEENKSESQGKKRSLFGKIADWNNSKRQKWMNNAEARMKSYEPGEILLCPKCGSENFEIITETSTSGKDVSGGSACCGYMLFGPLGLLCGFCGQGKQTKSETFCLCKDCGSKFQKMTKSAMMSLSKEERAKYHEFQAAARKRRGIVDVEEVKDTAEKDSSAEKDADNSNQ